jgi:hypothetical protein
MSVERFECGRLKVAAASMLLAAGCASFEPQVAKLVEPMPNRFGCELEDSRIVQGITAGLVTERWRVTDSERPGHVLARRVVRGKHTLDVDIEYASTSYRLLYRDSQNLDYKRRDGERRIHGNANKWMRKADQAIALELVEMCSRR